MIILRRYIGAAFEDGFDLEATMKYNTKAGFRWRAQGADFDETFVVTCRCNNGQQRSVSFPDRWRIALKCKSLPAIIDEAAQKAREEHGVHVTCTLLGQPKRAALPPIDAETGKKNAVPQMVEQRIK